MSSNKQTPQQLSGVMYQIYPRSFKDSNGDGVGDLRGIISKLDHLQTLGIDTLWLSPIYPSPMADFGYDISDYCNIDPAFGTLEDFDELIRQAKKRKIRIVMDYVINHTSDMHAWFIESRSGTINVKKDWYIWVNPGDDGGPPNNWLSLFGGSAWEYVKERDQYYLHTFLKEQPDLNWRNEEVKHAMLDAMRFWIDRGVDGFRTDAFAHTIKDAWLRDEPYNPHFRAGDWEYTQLNHTYTQRHPDLALLYEYFDQVFDEYPDRDLFMVTEDYAGIEDIKWHYSHSNSRRFAPLNLEFSELVWTAESVRHFVNEYATHLSKDSWPNYALGNHDQRRVAERVGENNLRNAALLQLTLRGTPIIYYGEEIGMSNVDIPRSMMQDPVTFRDPNNPGRDPQRTPMQWDDSKNAGFSNTAPWLPISKRYKTVNVEKQEADPDSLLSLYAKIIALRKASPALSLGTYRVFHTRNQELICYWREHGTEKVLVVVNFSEEPQSINLGPERYSVLLSNNPDFTHKSVTSNTEIMPLSGLILRATA